MSSVKSEQEYPMFSAVSGVKIKNVQEKEDIDVSKSAEEYFDLIILLIKYGL